ncbi:MAG: hypothetical protein H0T91_09865 [Propionibacteriaceae bacterium]|nr:hypothetical protein [Propionibacteriaceae bacterium]
MVEWTTPTGATHTVQAEPVPVSSWWPPPRETPCPCDACDKPRVTESDITDALPGWERPDDLRPDQIEALLAAAAA